MSTAEAIRINQSDFGTGVIAGLAAEGITSLSVRGLDSKLVDAFNWLAKQADTQNLNLRFHISLNRIHQDAPEARNAIRGAVARGLAYADDDHTLYLRIDKESATLYFARLPGSEELWRGVARVITHS